MTQRDPFDVDYLNSDSRAMTDAALDDAESHEAFKNGQLVVEEDD